MRDEWVEFVNARLDETEQRARAADVKQGDPDWWVSPVRASFGEHFTVRSKASSRPIARVQRLEGSEPDDEPGNILDGEAAAEHIAANDPAFVLGWVEQLRKILADHREQGGECIVCLGYWVTYPCPTVRSLADIWRDHPEHPGRQQ